MDIDDPNLMVTIAATRIGKLTYPSDADWGRTGPAVTLINGADDDETDKSICTVLEAIACLSVSTDRMQVVAVALQLNDDEMEATITIAENTTVPDSLITHITELLAGLHDAAGIYETLRTRDRETHLLQSTFPAEITAIRKKLLQAVYRYSILKNMRRYSKWLPRLQFFLRFLRTAKHPIDKSEAIRLTLESTYAGLKKILGDNKDKTGELTSKEWDELISAMDTIIPQTDAFCVECEKYANAPSASAWETEMRKTVTSQGKVKPWASDAEGGIKTFPVRHAVGKLTSQHRYMRNLFNDATSSSLRRLFLHTFTVRAVPKNDAVPIILPKDPAELKSIVEIMYNSVHDDQVQHVIDPLMAFMTPKFKFPEDPKKPADGVVHCECSLVAYLEGIRKTIRDETDEETKKNLITNEPAPFNYLGVSKLSCGACHAWLMAFNLTTKNDLIYHTAGTHSMWYPLWAMPPSLLTDELGNKMAETVCQRFVRYCDPASQKETAPVVGTGSAFAGTWRGTRW